MNKLDTITATINEMSRSDISSKRSIFKGSIIRNMLTLKGSINDPAKFRDARPIEDVIVYNNIKSLSYCRYDISIIAICQEFPSIDRII